MFDEIRKKRVDEKKIEKKKKKRNEKKTKKREEGLVGFFLKKITIILVHNKLK